MKELVFRPLRANEIECRVGSTKKDDKGVIIAFTLLLYKTARADANVLDETVGCFNWQKKFYQVKNTMICSLGINVNYDDPSKEPLWVWKDDAGDETDVEQVKGEASDSFKRAAFAYGVARELYDSPDIWVNVDSKNTHKGYYSVKTINYDKDKKIIELEIINSRTKEVVFSWKNGKKTAISTSKVENQQSEDKPIQEKEKLILERYLFGLDQKKSISLLNWLDRNYKTSQIDKLTDTQAKEAIERLKI